MHAASRLQIPDGSGNFLYVYRGNVEAERTRSMFPVHRSYVMSNNSIGADLDHDSDDTDMGPPPLEATDGHRHFIWMLNNGVETRIDVNTMYINTYPHLFGGAIDIHTPLTTDIFLHVDPVRDVGLIDNALRTNRIRWRRTTRIPSHVQPSIVTLPSNGLRYQVQ